jgi:molybdopterin-guanine dinucleotide biosynthesis protein B
VQPGEKVGLVVDLVREMTGRGLRVGTLKHSSHHHPVDRPGKDSWLHRGAGAAPAAFVSTAGIGVYLDRAENDDPLDRVLPLYADVDLLLVEGFIDRPGEKIEVYRAAAGGTPIARDDASIVAVVTDDPVDVGVPVRPRSHVGALADWILSRSVLAE